MPKIVFILSIVLVACGGFAFAYSKRVGGEK